MKLTRDNSGFLLHPPSTIVDSNRPAYGGTCYTTFTIGQSINVLAYNSTTLTATQPWVASSSADQAYAHVIDGFAMAEVSVSTVSKRISNPRLLPSKTDRIPDRLRIGRYYFFLFLVVQLPFRWCYRWYRHRYRRFPRYPRRLRPLVLPPSSPATRCSCWHFT